MLKILIKNAHICDPATNMDCQGDIFLVDGVIADIGTNLEYETEVTIDASEPTASTCPWRATC